MRKMFALGTILCVIVFLTTQANAQRFGGGMGAMGLLTNKAVQEEIKLTEDQRDKIGEKMKEQAGKMGEMFTKLKSLPKDEIPKLLKEMQESTTKELSTILKPEQIKRLKQIERQQNIVNSLTTDEEVAKELKVTDAQKEKFKTIREDMGRDLLALRSAKDDLKEIGEKTNALLKEANEKSLKVLTSEQQAKWKELTGEPFVVKYEIGNLPPMKGKKKKN